MKIHPVSLAVAASLLTSTSIWAETSEKEDNTESLTVVGKKTANYAVVDAPATLRSEVPILDTPRSIQVINRDLIEDADLVTLEDALKYVSGTSARSVMGGADTQMYIRGFRGSFTYRNGKKEFFEDRMNLHTVESIEVLKGPASVQFGVNAPGGIINYTTKRPQAESMRSFKVRLDEHGKREFIADFTGATNDTNNVLYRLIAAGEDSTSFRDFSEQKTYTIAPSLTFQLTDSTALTAALEVRHSELPLDRGIPFGKANDGSFKIADVPVSRKFNEPVDKSIDDKRFLDLILSHELNSDWRGELSYSYQDWESHWSNVFSGTYFPDGGTSDGISFAPGEMTRSVYGMTQNNQKSHQGSALLFGNFELAGTSHKLSIGSDYSYSDGSFTFAGGGKQPSDDVPSKFNIHQPVYGNLTDELRPFWTHVDTYRTYGIFANDTVYIGDKLVANLALRYDDYDRDSHGGWSLKQNEDSLVWNAGVLYKLIPEVSFYASYATSYEPNSAKAVVGEVKPSEGKQWELGVKGIAFSDSLQYSLVYYDIVKTNIPNSLEDINGNDIVKLIGEQTSKGIELDTNWQVTDELTVLLNYAYTDAEISKNTEDPEYVGNTPEGIPEHSGALFVTYDLNPVIPNLSLSAGANYVDDVPNKNNNDFFVPSYARFDLGLKYRLPVSGGDSVIFQAGVKNLTDEAIFVNTGKSSLAVGQARTFYGNVDYRF